MIIFNHVFEPQQAFIPLGIQLFQPVFQFVERFRRQGVTLFPPNLMYGD